MFFSLFILLVMNEIRYRLLVHKCLNIVTLLLSCIKMIYLFVLFIYCFCEEIYQVFHLLHSFFLIRNFIEYFLSTIHPYEHEKCDTFATTNQSCTSTVFKKCTGLCHYRYTSGTLTAQILTKSQWYESKISFPTHSFFLCQKGTRKCM